MISISFYITTCQGHRMHASIHHDDIETFAPILQLHGRSTYEVMTYAEAY